MTKKKSKDKNFTFGGPYNKNLNVSDSLPREVTDRVVGQSIVQIFKGTEDDMACIAIVLANGHVITIARHEDGLNFCLGEGGIKHNA